MKTFLLWSCLVHAILSRAKTITQGPLASVSIDSEPPYSSARACAAGCIVYDGVYHCGVNAGYNDLALELGCGCSPNNACFCRAGFASSATSYVSSCVSNACAESVQNWQAEAPSMLSFYNGYCATATLETSTSQPATGPETTTGSATASEGAIVSPTAQTTSAEPASTSATSPSAGPETNAPKEDEGLSKSDIVALAASLGVGIPGLLIAIITLCIQLKKRNHNRVDQMHPARQHTGRRPPPPPEFSSETALRDGTHHRSWSRGGGQWS